MQMCELGMCQDRRQQTFSVEEQIVNVSGHSFCPRLPLWCSSVEAAIETECEWTDVPILQ